MFPVVLSLSACGLRVVRVLRLRVLGAVFGSFPRIALCACTSRVLTHLAAFESCFASFGSRVARSFSRLCVASLVCALYLRGGTRLGVAPHFHGATRL